MADVPAAPSMAGVYQNTNDQKTQALDAMARYGQAGLDAFNQAQQNVQGYRQQVLNSILNAGGMGQDAKDALSAQVQQSLAPRLADLSQGAANLSADVARGNDMYSRYAAEANAAVPVIQAQQQQQMGIRDQALALAQQQIDAQKAATAAQNAHELQIQQLQLAQQQAQTAAAQASAQAAQAKAAGGGPVTSTQGTAIQKGTESIAGAYAPGTGVGSPGRSDVTDQMMQVAEDRAAFNGTDPTYELAQLVAQSKGISTQAAQAYLTPDIVAAMNGSKQLNPPPPKDVTTVAKYTGGDVNKAKQVLAAPEFQQAEGVAEQIGSAPVDANGLISDGSWANGLTPRQAFEQWMRSQPGTLTMKNAAINMYGSYLDSMTKK